MLLYPLVGAVSLLAAPFHPQAVLYYMSPLFSMSMVAFAGAWYLKMDKITVLLIIPCTMLGILLYGFTFLAAFFIPSVSWKGVRIKK